MEWNILATPKFWTGFYHIHIYIKHYPLEIKYTNTTEQNILSSTSFVDLHPKAFTKGTLGSQDDKVVWNHQDQIGDTQQQGRTALRTPVKTPCEKTSTITFFSPHSPFVNHTTMVRLFVHFLHAAIEHKAVERWVALFYFTLHRPLNSS